MKHFLQIYLNDVFLWMKCDGILFFYGTLFSSCILMKNSPCLMKKTEGEIGQFNFIFIEMNHFLSSTSRFIMHRIFIFI